MSHALGSPVRLWPLWSKKQGRPRGRWLKALCVGALLMTSAACSGQAEPLPGATFQGAIETGARAGSGAIDFAVSEDGASIADLGLTLTDVDCDGLTLGSTHDQYGGSLTPIESGRFSGAIPAVGTGGFSTSSDYSVDAEAFASFPAVADLASVGHLEGEFSSAEEAAGTITIHIWVIGTDMACELGTFPWSASAQQG